MCKTEYLGDGITIVVSPEHTFGTDAVLLAHFANVKGRDLPLDMGTGCGIIPLLWCRKPLPALLHCLDIQSTATQQVEQSIAMNRLEQRLLVYQWDLRKIRSEIKAESFTIVTMNPPYKPLHTGIESASESAKIARHETECTVDDACAAATYLLRYGGRFCMCHRPERLMDVLDAFRKNQLEPKRIRFVIDKIGQEPFLFLVEGRKGGKSGMRVLPQLTIRQNDGKFTEEMFEIYGAYAEGYHR